MVLNIMNTKSAMGGSTHGGILANDGRELLSQNDLKDACIRRYYGISNDDDETSKEVIKKRVVHEAGHVVISELREPGMVNFASVFTKRAREIGGYVSKKQK